MNEMTIKRKLQYQVRTLKGYILGVGDTPEEAIYNASYEGILKGCNLCESYIEEVFIDGELVKMNEHIQKIKRIK